MIHFFPPKRLIQEGSNFLTLLFKMLHLGKAGRGEYSLLERLGAGSWFTVYHRFAVQVYLSNAERKMQYMKSNSHIF